METHFYVPPLPSEVTTFSNVHYDNPELSELRGKIAWIKYSVYWADPGSDEEKQDNHEVGLMTNLHDDEWKHVKNFLNKSMKSRDLPGENGDSLVYRGGDDDKLHVNFLSGTIDFPWQVASSKTLAHTGSSWLATGLSSVDFPSKWPDFPRSSSSIQCKGINYLFGEKLNDSNFT